MIFIQKLSRVERHIISKSHKLYSIVDEYCFKSKNIYNYANYTVRQEYIKNQKYIGYPDSSKLLKNSEPFKDIGSNSAQMTLKILHQNWTSFFEIIKDFSLNSQKYLGRPHIPGYLKKDSRFVWVLTNVQSKIVDGYLKFSFKPLKPYNNLVKTKVSGKHLQTRFIPKGDHYVMEIVYEIDVPQKVRQKNRVIGIDLGVSRFATVQNNLGLKPFAINGGGIKAANNFFNKEIAKYKSISKKVNGLDWTKRLQKITSKRTNVLENFLHSSSRYIVNYCIEHQIDTVVVGYNEKWKQNVRMGKATQHFVYIPFKNFVSKLEYKLEEAGINFVQTEESYTSKASFLDGDIMGKNNYSGDRIERGLYKSSNGILINADVNGASNIIKKVFPNAFTDGIKGVHLHPTIVNLMNRKRVKQNTINVPFYFNCKEALN